MAAFITLVSLGLVYLLCRGLGIVGLGKGGSGDQTTWGTNAREGKTGEQIVGQAHGKYFEAASRGALFAVSDQGAGQAVGTALGTAAMLSLYNPAGSGVRLALKKRALIYVSGTLGTGVALDCVNTSATQAAPTGTATTPTNLDIGNTALPKGIVKLTATTVLPVAIWPIAYLAPELATSVTAPQQGYEDLDGMIVIEPGCSYQIQAVAAAGTSPKMAPAIVWEEVPLT